MQRREFITLLGGAAASWPLVGHAQQPMPVIGILHGGAANAFSKQIAFMRQGLRDGGYVEGQNVTIEFRWAIAAQTFCRSWQMILFNDEWR